MDLEDYITLRERQVLTDEGFDPADTLDGLRSGKTPEGRMEGLKGWWNKDAGQWGELTGDKPLKARYTCCDSSPDVWCDHRPTD